MNLEFGKTLVSNLYRATGIQGVLDALRRMDGADMEQLKPLVEQVIPAPIVDWGADRYEQDIHLRTHLLLRGAEVRVIVLVGPPDLALLRALAAARFRGVLRVILSGVIDGIDAERLRRNVPPGVHVEFELPTQRLPALRVADTIIAIGFDAGADMVLVDRHAPGIIRQMVRRRENGSARLMQPAIGEPVYERTSALATAARSLFHTDGLDLPAPHAEVEMRPLQEIRGD